MKQGKKQYGALITNNVILEKHELLTVNFFLSSGIDIELIPRSYRRGIRTPDFYMGGLAWEMKSPQGQGKYVLQDAMRRAAKQSENIIIDLRRIKLNQLKCVRELEKQFNMTKALRNLKIITKSQEMLEFKKDV